MTIVPLLQRFPPNSFLICTEIYCPALRFWLIRVDQNHVMIDTVKKSEDGSSMIVRLYEYGGIQGEISVLLDERLGKIAAIEETDLMEEKPVLLHARDHDILLLIKPYEIKTLRIQFKS